MAHRVKGAPSKAVVAVADACGNDTAASAAATTRHDEEESSAGLDAVATPRAPAESAGAAAAPAAAAATAAVAGPTLVQVFDRRYERASPSHSFVPVWPQHHPAPPSPNLHHTPSLINEPPPRIDLSSLPSTSTTTDPAPAPALYPLLRAWVQDDPHRRRASKPPAPTAVDLLDETAASYPSASAIATSAASAFLAAAIVRACLVIVRAD